MRRVRGRSNSNRRNNSSRPHSFDSNGPDVKVRGNAQQVVEKYLQLGRDAATSGDPVTAENYFQHAEHYQRIQTANGGERGERGQREAANGGSQPQPEPAAGAAAEAANGASQPAEAAPKAAPAGAVDDADIPASKPAAAGADEGSAPDAS